MNKNKKGYLVDFGDGIKPVRLTESMLFNVIEECNIDDFAIINEDGTKTVLYYDGNNWNRTLMEGFNKKPKDKFRKDKPLDKSRHYMKSARGINRKNPSYIPDYKKKQYGDNLKLAKRVLSTAKGASSGTWKITNKQAAELGAKYNFNLPDSKKRVKHLGSTGIMMIYKKGRYYLHKSNKHIRER